METDARWAGNDINVYEPGVSSSSRGLVGDTVFAVLPNIVPVHAFALTALCQVVSSKHSEAASGSDLYPIFLDLSCQAVENSDVQKLLVGFDALRMGLIHVWMACA